MTVEDREQRNERLAQLVARHRVVFCVWPAKESVGGALVSVGFDLEILGAHLDTVRGVLPGCERCVSIWADLRTLAEAVIPDQLRPTISGVQDFDHALHTRPKEPRDDVRLVVSLRHREGVDRPIDACEERCLHEMTAALRSLGAKEGHWKNGVGKEPPPTGGVPASRPA